MVRILIADDHEVVRLGLRSVLDSQSRWTVIGEAADGRDAVCKAIELKPDVLVLDYALPLIDGVDVTRMVRLLAPSVEILIFTMYENEKLVYDFLTAGVRGYVLKSDATRSLVAAIKSVSAHRSFFTATIAATLVEWYLKPASASELSPGERKVIRLIAEGNTLRQIGGILNISVKTVESRRSNAMCKLNVSSSARLVRYAIRNKLAEA